MRGARVEKRRERESCGESHMHHLSIEDIGSAPPRDQTSGRGNFGSGSSGQPLVLTCPECLASDLCAAMQARERFSTAGANVATKQIPEFRIEIHKCGL